MAAIEAFWLTNGDPWGPAPPPATNSLGVIGTYYVQPPDFDLATLRKRRCRCRKGVASLACAMHCQLVIDRRNVEEELLVLMLV